MLNMLESFFLHLQPPNKERGKDKITCIILLCQFLFTHTHTHTRFELHLQGIYLQGLIGII